MADVYFKNVTALIPFDGVSGLNTFIDYSASPKSVTTQAGLPVLSSDQKKFGNSSLYLNGSSSIQIAASSDFAFGTGDFTIELWYFPISHGTGRISNRSTGGLAGTWGLNFTITGGFTFTEVIVGEPVMVSVPNGSLLTGQWNHIAVSRSGGTAYAFVNGQLLATNANTTNFSSSANSVLIGRSAPGETNYLNCYIDDLRITKGVCRYTSTFTPPSELFIEIPDRFVMYQVEIYSKDFSSSVNNLMQFKTVSYTTQPPDLLNENVRIPITNDAFRINYTKFYDGYNIYSEVISDSVNGAGKFMMYRSGETVRPEVSQISNRINAIKSSGGSQEYAGFGRIYGTVTENSQEISCLLRLYDNSSGALVASTRSTATGLYEFENLKMSTTYTLVAYNPSKNYNSIIRDLIKPERM